MSFLCDRRATITRVSESVALLFSAYQRGALDAPDKPAPVRPEDERPRGRRGGRGGCYRVRQMNTSCSFLMNVNNTRVRAPPVAS